MKTLFLHPTWLAQPAGLVPDSKAENPNLLIGPGSWDLAKRRLREGVEFSRFLRAHEA